MKTETIYSRSLGRKRLAFAGFRLQQVLSEELFRELSGLNRYGTWEHMATACHDRWTDLVNALAALPQPAETLLIVGTGPGHEQGSPQVHIDLLVMGRGKTLAAASEHARVTAEGVGILLASTLDYAVWEPLQDKEELARLARLTESGHVVELRRRLEKASVSHGRIHREPVGFLPPDRQANSRIPADLSLLHLFPWVPSDDPWRRLLDTLNQHQGPTALIVHAQGYDAAPAPCREAARANLAAAERIALFRFDDDSEVDTVLRLQAENLRGEALRRLATLEGRTLAARLFIATNAPPANALIATALGSIDDASVRPGQPGTESLFRGGAQVDEVTSAELLAPLADVTFDQLFGPAEAAAFFRTPMPADLDYPGLPIKRARTAPLRGTPGDDAPLGTNRHRYQSQDVALDGTSRFRHTYVIGQTGTGKSTLMQHMILHDIRQGRGVAVLDPHGSLIDDILLRYPKERAEDLVLVDVTDIERPIGFNVLRIPEEDPLKYRLARDLIVDELYSYLDRLYDLKRTGGPIFETHFRGGLGLLMGSSPPPPERIPSLLVFRAIYTNHKLRSALTRLAAEHDIVLRDMVKEAQKAGGEASLDNLAPYITSKFSRFISDTALRNITCQPRILDLDAIIREGKVLLFYLGKGRFGEHAAALLAGQIVSRVWYAVTERGAGNGPPFYLYADEFQLFADERFAEILAEARKFRLSLTVAHQYADQVPEAVLNAILGNVGTVAVMRVGARDGERFAPLFRPTFADRDLSSLSNFTACVRSQGTLGNVPFSMDITPPEDSVNARTAAQLRTLSRERYGTPREQAEWEIMETYKRFEALT